MDELTKILTMYFFNAMQEEENELLEPATIYDNDITYEEEEHKEEGINDTGRTIS